MELFLQSEGFKVRTAANGEEALRLLENFVPDIILADAEMPVMGGYELCEHIKTDPRLSQIPVLILYSAFDPFDDNRALSVGADGTLAKPFESQELLEAVQALLVGKTPAQDSGQARASEIVEEDVLENEGTPAPPDGLDEEWSAGGVQESEAAEAAWSVRSRMEREEAVKKAIREELPGVVQRVVRESLEEMLESMRGVIEETIRTGIPKAAEEIIRREIEKITSQKG
ncbi:MAG: response regulator [Nitrospirales bacterium]|nr:response regulator [Nitrospirales bacterium]